MAFKRKIPVMVLLAAWLYLPAGLSAWWGGLEKNRPILDLPVAGQKLVMAHAMTEFLQYKGNNESIFMRQDLYSPDGPTANLGGMLQYQTIQAALPEYRDLDIVDAAAFEMKTAKKMGIDGFQFYYPLVYHEGFTQKYNDIIKAHFKAAERDNLDFKLTLCLSNPREGDKEKKLAHWTKSVGDILQATGQSSKWLRTPDGRYLFYLYSPDTLADGVKSSWEMKATPGQIKKVAEAYEELNGRLNARIAYIYHLRFPEDDTFVNAALDYFPAIWGWIDPDPDKNEADWKKVAATCKARKRTYTQTVYDDFYDSKLIDIRGGGYRLPFEVEEVQKLKMEDVVRDCVPTRLSYFYRRLLQRAVDTDAALLNFVTWNDFPEGHHLAPEINHNFGLDLLLKHYKGQWLGQPEEDPEAAVVFYKKYAHTVKPEYFPSAVRFWSVVEAANEAKDDFIDVVTLLKEKADVYFKGRKVGTADKGLNSTLIPTEPGPVRVEIRRGGKRMLKVSPPEWITEHPYRTDRITFIYSSDTPEKYREIFGDAKIPVSDEYAQDKNGVPNWKKRYKFWKTATTN